jgi:yersiniabactin salicyl-AMP ligase
MWNGIRESCEGWENKTYADKIKEWSVVYAQNNAVIDDTGIYTYEELYKRVRRVAGYFYEQGLRCGDRVVFQLYNSEIFLTSCFALFELGVIPVMMLPAHKEAELQKILITADPVAYIGTRNFMGTDYELIVQTVLEKENKKLSLFYDDELRREAENFNAFSLPEDREKPNYKDLAMLLLSGGTTNVPKLIGRTHGDYIYDNKMMAERCRLSADDNYLAVIPIAHNFSWGNPGVLGTLYSGGTVIMLDAPSPADILDYVEEYKVTFTSLVPSLLRMCIDYRNVDDSNALDSLKFVMVGGSVLERELAEQVEPVMGTKLMQIFGTAEGLNCSTSLDDDFETIVSCQGKAISPYDVIRIVDEDGNEVGDGQIGELITKGPYTITEYYKLGDDNKKYFTEDGFYKTGDRARIRKDGNIEILGRNNDQINRAGEKIMPVEVEDVIRNHPMITDCVVIGIKDRELGQKVCACIISETDLKVKELQSFLRERGMTEYKIPELVVRMDSWPLTAVNKIDRKKIKEQVEMNYGD